MRNRMFMFTMIMATLLMFACSNDSTTVSPVMPQTDVTDVAAFAGESSSTGVYTWPPELNLVGSAKLKRGEYGVSMKLKTTDIPAGNAITVWWVVFNNPEECATSPCTGEGDIGVPAVQADVLYATGQVIDGSGKSKFAAQLSVGDTSGSLFDQPSAGLIDPSKAEIHLVVRDHGPEVPELMPEMIETFNGGCLPDDGPNECSDIQFAIFSEDDGDDDDD